MIRGPVLIPICLGVIVLTMGCFYLNAVFAFAVDGPRPPELSRAFRRAHGNLKPVLIAGAAVGVPLAIATAIAPRWGSPWFALTLGPVLAVMMISYVAVPARLIGAKKDAPRRDRLTASVLSTVIGTTVCTPPYVLARLGILMLGSNVSAGPRDRRARARRDPPGGSHRRGAGDQAERGALAHRAGLEPGRPGAGMSRSPESGDAPAAPTVEAHAR